MQEFDRFPDNESELHRAQSDLLRERRSGPTGDCPSAAELSAFASGKYHQGDPAIGRILGHLGECERCNDVIISIRRRRIRTRRFVLAFASAIILAAATWFLSIHDRGLKEASNIATIDLRNVAPTRGIDSDAEPASIALSRDIQSVRILLPVESAEGDYEAGIFRPEAQGSPILSSSGRTNLENHDVVLGLSLGFRDLKPGRYLLGTRHGGSGWQYYSLTVN
jgi:hypothetical protein